MWLIPSETPLRDGIDPFRRLDFYACVDGAILFLPSSDQCEAQLTLQIMSQHQQHIPLMWWTEDIAVIDSLLHEEELKMSKDMRKSGSFKSRKSAETLLDGIEFQFGLLGRSHGVSRQLDVERCATVPKAGIKFYFDQLVGLKRLEMPWVKLSLEVRSVEGVVSYLDFQWTEHEKREGTEELIATINKDLALLAGRELQVVSVRSLRQSRKEVETKRDHG